MQDAAARVFVIPLACGKAVKFQDYAVFKENFGQETRAGLSVTLHRFDEKP